MRRGICLAIALLAGVSASGAGAAPRVAPDRAARIARWERGRAVLAGHLPLDPAIAAATSVYDDARLVRAGDLDKDGGVDVVDVRYHGSYDDVTGLVTESMRLEAHRGRDGKPLWTAPMGSASYVFPMAAKVGPAGAPGLVVVSYTEQFADLQVGFAETFSTTVTALDSAGKQLWSQFFPGGYAVGPNGDVAVTTYVTGVLNAVKGGGDDVLVETVTGASGYDPSGTASLGGAVAQLTLVDGATGTTRPFGGPIPSSSWDVNVAATNDLNGDGLDDAAAVVSSGPATEVVALSGAQGAPLWVARGLPGADMSFPVAVPDATGDGVGDVAVSRSPWGAGPLLAGWDGGAVTLVDGKSGTVRWTKPGEAVYVIGDVDRKPGVELALAALLDDDETFGFTASAYGADAKPLWTVRRTVKPVFSGSGMLSVGFGLVGDLQDDGAADLGYGVTMVSSGGSSSDEGTVDGRSGRVRRNPVASMYAPMVALDGHGADRYTRDTVKGSLVVAAWRGDTGGRLWRTTLATGARAVRSFGVAADRDRCADLFVATRDERTSTSVDYALSGATGLPLWSLVRRGDGPGAVARAAVKAHTRYARTC